MDALIAELQHDVSSQPARASGGGPRYGAKKTVGLSFFTEALKEVPEAPVAPVASKRSAASAFGAEREQEAGPSKRTVKPEEASMAQFLETQAADVAALPVTDTQCRAPSRAAAKGKGPRCAVSQAPSVAELCAPAEVELPHRSAEEEEKALPPLQLPLPEGCDGAVLQYQPQTCALTVPGDLASKLRPFQVEGVRFLHRRWCLAPGCLLADDMGLGKTLQTIAFLAALTGKKGKAQDTPPVASSGHQALVVVPKSLMSNWKRELDTWASFAHATMYGPREHKEKVMAQALAGEVEVVLTTYNIYQNHLREFQEVHWSMVVFDEAQCMANHKTLVYNAAAKAPDSAFKILLSGTPGSNKLEQLFTLLDLAVPDCLGMRAHFKEFYAHVINLGQRVNATREELATSTLRARKLMSVVQTHMLQRKKSDLPIKQQLAAIMMALPKKKEIVVFCELSPLQRRAYNRLVDSRDFELLRRYQELCDCGSGACRGKCCHTRCNGVFFNIKNHDDCTEGKCPTCVTFNFLHLVQKVANHLELIKPDPNNEDVELRARDARVAQAILGPDADEAGGVWASNRIDHLADGEHCGKLKALHHLLQQWRSENCKVLVFSHSVELLRILEKFLMAREHTFVTFDGSVSVPERARLVEEFNNRPSTFIFLGSIKACGTGLNLVSANRVVIFDPNWNPAVDQQAQDRCFRIGQKRDVNVYRLVGANTVEEIMYLRQVAKTHSTDAAIQGTEQQRLFTGVQDDKRNRGELWGMENLFAVHAEDQLARKVLDRAAKIEKAYIQMDLNSSDVEEDEEDKAPKEEPVDEIEDPNDMDLAALQQAGVDYNFDHGSVLEAGAAEGRVAAAARAAIGHAQEDALVARKSRLRAEVPARAGAMAAPGCGLRVGGAPHGGAGGGPSLLAPLAAHFQMSVPDMARRLVSTGRLERDNLVELCLTAAGRMRTPNGE